MRLSFSQNKKNPAIQRPTSILLKSSFIYTNNYQAQPQQPTQESTQNPLLQKGKAALHAFRPNR